MLLLQFVPPGSYFEFLPWLLVMRPRVLVRVSIAVKRHHDHDNCYKGKHLIEVIDYSFRRLAHYHDDGTWRLECGSVQENIVLEKELRVLHPNPKATGS